ncbi:MAG: hypothetical protein QG608_3006 [Actinomycetota bacterium]|nr:hypothetical protein [Actinomycetota bacterium]
METALPRPLALAVVSHLPSASEYERSCARVEVSLRAKEEGYGLVELFDLLGIPQVDRGAWAGASEVAARGEVRAVFVSGVEMGDLPECLSGLVMFDVSMAVSTRALLLGSSVGWSRGCESGDSW